MPTTRSGKRSDSAAATLTEELTSSGNRLVLEEIKNLQEDMISMSTVFLSAISFKNEVIGKLKGESNALNAKIRKL